MIITLHSAHKLQINANQVNFHAISQRFFKYSTFPQFSLSRNKEKWGRAALACAIHEECKLASADRSSSQCIDRGIPLNWD